MIKTILEINMNKFVCGNCPLIALDEQKEEWYCIWTEDEINPFKDMKLDNCPLILSEDYFNKKLEHATLQILNKLESK